MKKITLLFVVLFLSCVVFWSCKNPATNTSVSLQLNWLHDPTFTGEYLLAKRPEVQIVIKEGGPNITPIAEVLGGRANVAVVGADIFLQALEQDKKSDLVCFFIDFQRNPVGWVLHPDAAAKAGLSNEVHTAGELNKWLFAAFSKGAIKPGDKRGTETTSIWVQWKEVHQLPESVTVVPVGFDSSIVLSSPPLAYPVYLNEEPFKLSETIGRDVVVFDPAADGIELYGNVLVTTRQFALANSNVIRALQTALRASWQQAQADRKIAASEVSALYKGVSESILEKQINRTLDFVFYGNKQPGAMDITPDGRWEKTLKALQKADLVGPSVTLETLKNHLVTPE
jgi:hypothetical protein